MTDRRRALLASAAAYGLLILALGIEMAAFEILGRMEGKPGFLTAPSVLQIFNRSADIGVMAVAMTFVILTAGIDLSVGSVAAFCGVVGALVLQRLTENGIDPYVALTAAIGVALAAGALAGGVAGGLVTLARVPPFIATLALMSSLRGLAFIAADGKPIRPMGGAAPAWQALGRSRLFDTVQTPILVMGAVFAAGACVLGLTRFGRHAVAVGGNEEAARLTGVPVNRVKFAVYAGSGALAALSGLIVSSKLGAGDPKVAVGAELEVIAAVVVGGTSLAGGRASIVGTFLGLAIISTLGQGLTWLNVESFGQQVILGVVILAAVLLDRIRARA